MLVEGVKGVIFLGSESKTCYSGYTLDKAIWTGVQNGPKLAHFGCACGDMANIWQKQGVFGYNTRPAVYIPSIMAFFRCNIRVDMTYAPK